jgi:pyrroline-5-carboxylate reductase
MRVGFIGSGNMARALARGWGEPVLATDAGSGRAEILAGELRGERVGSNRELAERADVVILAHKPYQLHAVAEEAAPAARVVVSLLAGTTQADVRAAYPGSTVFRVEPNTAVEVRQGVMAFAVPDTAVDDRVHREVQELFERVGTVVNVPEPLMPVAGAISGVGPAYWALFAEAQVDAAVRHGMPAELAIALVAETIAGAAALIRLTNRDTLAIRRQVTSPGGTTARGLAALERGGVRAALDAAMDDVVG